MLAVYIVYKCIINTNTHSECVCGVLRNGIVWVYSLYIAKNYARTYVIYFIFVHMDAFVFCIYRSRLADSINIVFLSLRPQTKHETRVWSGESRTAHVVVYHVWLFVYNAPRHNALRTTTAHMCVCVRNAEYMHLKSTQYYIGAKHTCSR